MRNLHLTLVFLLLGLLLPSCGSVTAGTKLAKVTGLTKAMSKFGSLKKLGFGTGVLVVGQADNSVQFVASKAMEGLDALCQTQEFLQWVDQQGEATGNAPASVLADMNKAFPGGKVEAGPRQFENGFWVQCSTFDGQRYVVVHRSGETTILAPAGQGTRLAALGLIWLGYLGILFLAGYSVIAVIVYLRKGSLGTLSPSRLGKSYMAAITPKPASERTKGILGVLGCLFLMGHTVHHHLWIKQVVATPIVRTAADLSLVDWNGEQLMKLDCEPGPTLRKFDDEEYQLRTVGDLAVVAYFDDARLTRDRLLIGYAKPLPPGLVESIEARSKAKPVGMIEARWVNESTGVLWWAVMWFLGSFCGLLYFWRGLRRGGVPSGPVAILETSDGRNPE